MYQVERVIWFLEGWLCELELMCTFVWVGAVCNKPCDPLGDEVFCNCQGRGGDHLSVPVVK